jgi:hypothetical protein
MRYFQVVLVNNIINAAAAMLSNHFSCWIQQVLNRLNFEVLSAIICLISSSLDIVLWLAANNVLDLIAFECRFPESISACKFPATTRIIAILKFVGQDEVSQLFVELAWILVLVGELALAVLGVGCGLPLLCNCLLVFTAHCCHISADRVILNEVLVGLACCCLLVATAGQGSVLTGHNTLFRIEIGLLNRVLNWDWLALLGHLVILSLHCVVNIDEIRYVLALALRSILKAWYGEMHVLHRAVLRFLKNTSLLVAFALSSILRNSLLHRSQVELGWLIALTDLNARLVRVDLVSNLLHHLLVVDTLRLLVLKCHLDVDIFEIRHEVGLLRRLQDVLIDIVNLVNLGMLGFTSYIRLLFGVLGGGRCALHVFFIHFGHWDGFVIYWLEAGLRRVVLHSRHIEQLLSL